MATEVTPPPPKSIRQRLEPLLAWPWILLPLLAGFGWLYYQTMPPGMSSWIVKGWDSAMFQVTGSSWGIPHSPGYPLYTILANLFVRVVGLVPGFIDSSVAWRVSLWSTFTSLLTLAIVYLIVRRLTRNRFIALGVSALLGVSFIFWRGAIMAEVYSLNALIFALVYWLALVWDIDRRERWLVLLGLILGAGLVHHRTAFILPPTIALWVMLRREKKQGDAYTPPPQRWRLILRRWLILGGFALLPLLSYLYLPWAAQHQVGQSWLYADASDWNTFWFMVLSREWWGLVQTPAMGSEWLAALLALFQQQADQMTAIGVIAGMLGLLLARRYFWLFGPPFGLLIFFGVSYKVADLDSMLIPLTLTLCISLGLMIGQAIRLVVTWLIKSLRMRGSDLRSELWLSTALRIGFSLLVLLIGYFMVRPLAETNYRAVDLSGDWQAEDLIEEVVAIAEAGTPLSIVGQDNSVLPDFIYAKVILNQPIEPLSTTTLSRMPEADSIALLQDRLERGNRLLVDIETIDLGFLPWLITAIETGHLFLAPTGHPFLWELLPRPISSTLPDSESWVAAPPAQLLDGRLSMVAFQDRIIHKRTGCFLRLTLFWQAEEPLTEDYFVSIQPLGGETVIDKSDHLALMRGYLPTSDMIPGEIVRDEIDLLIRQPAALPGIMLVINLYQVQGDQFPTFGYVELPVTVDPSGCNEL